jgi:hypothetical protein
VAWNQYSWGSKAATPTVAVPLVPGTDPEHLHPTDNLQYEHMDPLWMNSGGGVPTLPAEYWANDGVAAIVVPGGPIDRTPRTHDFGVGVGPGLDVPTAQAIRAEWGEEDLGAVDARRYIAASDRDGIGPTLAIVADTPGLGTSPQTNDLKITGVGGTNDPFARTGQRTQRSWDRRIDLHRYEVTYRPMTTKNAKTAQAQPAVPDGTQYTSPFETAATGWGNFQPDSFVAPQERRTPEPWDQPLTVDGSGVDNQVWGL